MVWRRAALALAAVFLVAPAYVVADPSPFEALQSSLEEVRGARQELLHRLDQIDAKYGAKPPVGSDERAITEVDRDFWSYQPLRRPEPPAVQNTDWPRNPVDSFVLKALEAQSLTPSPQTSPTKLIRRLYYDMIGLPPTPEAVAAFEADHSPEAYAALVEQLLASPQYGERWGRHWLDVARYADSDGYEFDLERPNAYHYRDFVIRAFNEDLPYDKFVKWQLAGDEIEPGNTMALAATGFCTSGPTIDNQQLELNRYDEWDDMLATTSVAFLGMTVSCARCHDHKYDAIPTRDYYRMLSAFTTTKRHNAILAPRAEAEEYRARLADWEARMKSARESLEAVLSPVRDRLRAAKIEALEATAEEKSLLLAPQDDKNESQNEARKKFGEATKVSDDEVRKSLDKDAQANAAEADRLIAATELEKPASPPVALMLTDAKAEPEKSYLLARGNPDAKSETVTLGFLRVLPGAEDARFDPATRRTAGATTTHQRAAMADWMMDVDHGAGRLAARVIANRIWGHHFGYGIVRTPNDFGTQGDRPSHPELLDWLAMELVENGWSIKHLHRIILHSATYQQSSEVNETALAKDPDNRLLWRRVPLRLEAEIIRDATLAVTNCLNLRMYGPGVFPQMPEDAIATGSTPKWPLDAKDGPDTWRRSVYVFVRRSARMPMIEAFDAPDTVVSCGRRLATVTPTQSLSMMNSVFSNEQAKFFADRIRKEVGDDREAWVRRAYELALNRQPSDFELAESVDFLLKQAQRHVRQEAQEAKTNYYALRDKDVDQAALTDFAQVVLSLNEFVYVD